MGRGRLEPPAPPLAAINAQSHFSFLSFLVVVAASPLETPCSLLGTGPASELNMAKLVGTPRLGWGEE